METKQIALHHILDNPYQPRVTDNAEHIEKLARSIAADGLLQVPTARHAGNGMYELAFGHSRRKAFEWLLEDPKFSGGKYDGFTKMPLNVEEITDEQMYRYAVSENVKRYMDEFGASSKVVGELFGMNDATVRGKVRLLDLPEKIQDLLSTGAISEGLARMLLAVSKR